MDVFGLPDFDRHERVVFGCDESSGLRAIVAIHSTVRGPGAGGCRMWPYSSTNEALTDVLRLSRGMSYKNAMAGLPFGGGKAVIIGDSRAQKSPELLLAYGKLVDSLGGRYVTAEDVGTTLADMEQVARATRFVSGLGHGAGKAGGDPAPKTAQGVFEGIQAAARFRLGRSDLAGLTVAIQGVGGVGYHLCRLLAAEGAALRVADVRAAAVERAADELGASPVSTGTVVSEDVDVFAPCALGGILNGRSIPKLRASIVAGAANNQLLQDVDGVTLHARGVLYAPDYVVNAGGIISVAREYLGGATEADVMAELHGIPARLLEIFERARRENRPTNFIADQVARELIGHGGQRKVA